MLYYKDEEMNFQKQQIKINMPDNEPVGSKNAGKITCLTDSNSTSLRSVISLIIYAKVGVSSL